LLLWWINCILICKILFNNWAFRHVNVLSKIVAVVCHLLIDKNLILWFNITNSTHLLSITQVHYCIVLWILNIILNFWKDVADILRDFLRMICTLMCNFDLVYLVLVLKKSWRAFLLSYLVLLYLLLINDLTLDKTYV
jgi:hypothetical protein